MAKKNKKYSRSRPDTDGDDIVISGMAGKFPNCKNISEYEYNLYNKCFRLGVLSQDGYCRPFDKDACGYSRSEAINCLFLQRKRDAKRIYASVVYSKTNCDGYKPEGITYPSGNIQRKLLLEFYKEIDLTPNDLGYLEAHCTGTVVGDPEECKAIDSVLCSQRQEPLLVGSVKSNIGHSEPASGICSLVKACFAFETGLIAPNINFTEVKRTIKALAEGRLVVVKDVTPLPKPCIAVNSFGFGGANAHAILKAHPKSKVNYGIPEDNLPRIVTWAGRTEDAVNEIFNGIEKKPLDAEFIGLLQNIQEEEVSGMVFRGYGIFGNNGNQPTKSLVRNVQHYTGLKRPIVWVFSGMGSQWNEMGASLMMIPRFRQSIEISHNTLVPKGLDLINILTSNDPAIYENILHSFVGIASVQIGLTDILRSLNLEPDFIIGHSVGELGCAYADGGVTAEQMILAAYCRGRVSMESKKIRGGMAAVGIGYRAIKNLLPEAIEVACHNSADSCTISGPIDEVRRFVAELKSKDIFAKEVPCSNIAYHSRYIASMGPQLLKYLKEIITQPKTRTAKWLSTSVPRSEWEQTENKLCSAEYHTNNLLHSVLFEETFAELPKNALTIEIAPHGLLGAILKRSMPNGVYIPLTHRGNKNNALFFMTALGKLYENGVMVPVANLYPKVEFPVSRSTPGISSLIRWDHSEDWFVTKYENMKTKASVERVFLINLASDEECMGGHIIDGKILVPATSYLQYVWKTFSLMHHGPSYTDISVEFEEVQFLRATNMSVNGEVELNVMINYGSGHFEITEAGSLVVTGNIREIEKPLAPEIYNFQNESKFPMLAKKDFYKELRLRGYHYNGAFQPVRSARADGLYGTVEWDYNWVTFMDAMLQIQILGTDSRSLLLPTKIRKLRINGIPHFDVINKMDPENRIIDVYVDHKNNRIVAGGIEVIGLHASLVQRRKPPGIPVLEQYEFLPYLPAPEMTLSNAARICVQLALENMSISKVKLVEVDTDGRDNVLAKFIDAIEDLPIVTGEYMYLTDRKIDEIPGIHIENGKVENLSNYHFIVAGGTRGDLNEDVIMNAQKVLVDNGYLLLRERPTTNISNLKLPEQFHLITVIPIDNNEEVFVLLQNISKKLQLQPTVVKVSDSDMKFEWISQVQSAISMKSAVVAYAFNEKHNGLVGLVNCLRKEPDGNLVTCFYIDDPKAPEFNLADPFYSSQFALGLAFNIYRHVSIYICELKYFIIARQLG
ncbi:GH19666 [Drosophila grimshawi]|uniref:GH19666 n=1 Tax=Drosophila grimshawi TaxID=7222 RepID=B4K109_DROGR|nr:GH19666 [Drosophila grimshawi]